MVVLSVHMCGIGSKFQLIATGQVARLKISPNSFLANFAHYENFQGKLEEHSKHLYS